MKTIVTMLAVLAAGSPAPAHPQLAGRSADPAPTMLTWRGEERWRLVLEDEAGVVALGFVQLPSGSYVVSGSLTLDDAELGVTGSARWRAGKLLLDLTILGGVRDVPPDPGKIRLYPKGTVPRRIDSTGFAMIHAELEGSTLDGTSAQYQTNVVTGNRLQGPVLRLGRLVHLDRP